MESLNQTPDVVIVSAYGRGHWLARELAAMSFRVSLVDVSDALMANQTGREAEDWEGPWGYFVTPELRATQVQRLSERVTLAENRGGFSLWLRQGPLEAMGPLSPFHAQSFEIPEDVRSYLLPTTVESVDRSAPAAAVHRAGLKFKVVAKLGRLNRLSGQKLLKPREGQNRRISKQRFADAWMAHLAHAYGANVFAENVDWLDVGHPLPLRSEFRRRYLTPEAFERELQDLERLGVGVTRRAEINDVRLSGSRVAGHTIDVIEVAAERRGVETGRAFVWCLSSLESSVFSDAIVRRLFPRGLLTPSWFWCRFRFALATNSATRNLPPSLIMIENEFLPWTHTNLLIVNRRSPASAEVTHERKGADLFDVWSLLPVTGLGRKDYFEQMAEETKQTLARRLPFSDPELMALPAEAAVASQAFSELRFPIYERELLHQHQTQIGNNFFFDGPEQWSGLTWNHQFQHQERILLQISRLRQLWLAEAEQGARP